MRFFASSSNLAALLVSCSTFIAACAGRPSDEGDSNAVRASAGALVEATCPAPGPSPSLPPVVVTSDGVNVPLDGTGIIDVPASVDGAAPQARAVVVRTTSTTPVTVAAVTSASFRIVDPERHGGSAGTTSESATIPVGDTAVLLVSAQPSNTQNTNGTIRFTAASATACVTLRFVPQPLTRFSVERAGVALRSDPPMPTTFGIRNEVGQLPVDLTLRNPYSVPIYLVAATVTPTPITVTAAPSMLAAGATAPWRFTMPKQRGSVWAADFRISYAVGAPFNPALPLEQQARIDEVHVPFTWVLSPPTTPPAARLVVELDGVAVATPDNIALVFATPTTSHVIGVTNTGQLPATLEVGAPSPITLTGTLRDAFRLSGTTTLAPGQTLVGTVRLDAGAATSLAYPFTSRFAVYGSY